ncbi:MAG: rhomboid family intramembrane serine protease [Candidatus Thermoplasmatota archaeon]|nr:rhomboid family intramembrane serine protease [Candidatus Thermoplasmatota archaeon]
MGLEFLSLGLPSIIAIAVIVGGIVISYYKKILMTYVLIVTNFIVFIISLIFQDEIIFGFLNNEWVYSGLGFRPIYLTPDFIPQIYTLFTSMFVHSDFLHIIGNMLIFYFIGFQFEQRVGWKNFIIIYLLAGICGSLTHSFLVISTYSNQIELLTPLVGASGAIFGIMGAFAFAYPQDRIVMPIPVGFFMIIRQIKVIFAVLIFAGLETVIVLIGAQDNTAHFAHLGGLIGGVVLSALIIKRKFKKDRMERSPEIITPIQFDLKPKSVDFSSLESLAKTPELRQMLDRIKQETVPQVRDIWIEHFLEKARCPTCQSHLNNFDGKIWCDKCGFKSRY